MSDAKSNIWATCELRQLLANDFPGAWGSDPGSKQANVSVLRSTNLDGEGHIDYSTGAKRYLVPRDLVKKKLVDGDILLEASGGGPGKPVGRVALFKSLGSGSYVSSNFFRTLRPQSIVDGSFLAWYLQWTYQQPSIWQFQQQTTGIINLKYRDYLRQSIALPEVQEQRRIAEILDTADEVLRSTERLIAKLQLAKKGLLHDILTRGIDESGHVRDPQRNPYDFVATELGLLPRSWKIMRLREVASYQNGGAFPSSEYSNEGIPLVRPGNLGLGERVSWDLLHTKFLPPRWGKVVPELLVGPGEVLMNLTAQSLDEGFLGRACITSDGTCCLLNQRIARFRPYSIQPDYLLWFFRGPVFRQQIARSSTGTKVQHLYNSDIDEIRIPVPQDTTESLRISDKLWSVSSAIDAETNHLNRSRLLKRGLMDDLLTGRVRVGASA